MPTKRDSRTKINELITADSVVDPEVASSFTQSSHGLAAGQPGNNDMKEQIDPLNDLEMKQLQLEAQLKQEHMQQQELQQHQLQQHLQQQAAQGIIQQENGLQIHHFIPVDKDSVKKHRRSVTEEDGSVKKCSRCRVKRTNETLDQLQKYATCFGCRSKRKVVKNPIDTSEPNTYLDYKEFIQKIKMNSSIDILQHKFKGYSDERVFRRFDLSENIDNLTYQDVGKKIIETYINPLMEETGFRFPVRDYHKGGSKNKKLTFMFICSQDSDKQRKSKNQGGRAPNNKLKTEHCESKISLSYSLIDGFVQIMYHHRSHEPYTWKRHSAMKPHRELNANGYSTGQDHLHHQQMQSVQDLRHTQHLLQHSLPQHPHHHNPHHIQLPPLQNIPADALPLGPTNVNHGQHDHRDLLSDVQNLQSYTTTPTPSGTNNNIQSYHQQQQHHQIPQQQQLQQSYQYKQSDSQAHQNSVIAAAVAAASAVDGVDVATALGEETKDDNIDKELIGLTGGAN